MSKHYVDRLKIINHLICIKGTGTPKQFALKLKIGESSLFEMLKLMKKLGAPIKYCKQKQSYYYNEDGAFSVQFLRDNKEG